MLGGGPVNGHGSGEHEGNSITWVERGTDPFLGGELVLFYQNYYQLDENNSCNV